MPDVAACICWTPPVWWVCRPAQVCGDVHGGGQPPPQLALVARLCRGSGPHVIVVPGCRFLLFSVLCPFVHYQPEHGRLLLCFTLGFSTSKALELGAQGCCARLAKDCHAMLTCCTLCGSFRKFCQGHGACLLAERCTADRPSHLLLP